MTDLARPTAYLPNGWDLEAAPPALPARHDPTQRLRDWVELFREVVRAAEFLSKTPFVPREMNGKPADVAAAIMKGHELGMDPLDALANMYIIHGRVGFYAEFMRRRIIQAGHTFRVVESTDSRCIVEGQRAEGGDPQRATFTSDQAKRAGIDLGKYPADKLLARATSRLCRQVFPDVLSGSLIAEDIIDGLVPASETELAAALPAGGEITRKRQPRPAKAAATKPAPLEAAPVTDDATELLEDTITLPAEIEPLPHTADPDLDDDGDGDGEEIGDDGEPAEDAADTAPVPAEAEELITAPQLKKLSIMLREAGFDTKESKHGFVAAAVGREVASAKDLTKSEATAVMDILASDAGHPDFARGFNETA